MFLYILIGLLVIIAAILITASTKPNTVRYERSIVVHAPPERILPHLVDFHKWATWSPWEKVDPGMKRDYSGAASGRGARYAWNGNGKAGEGSMEVMEVTSNAVNVDLRFIKPFKNECNVWFSCVPEGANTRLSWTMEGPNLFMGKVMSLFINMDKLIGKDFESGLVEVKKKRN